MNSRYISNLCRFIESRPIDECKANIDGFKSGLIKLDDIKKRVSNSNRPGISNHMLLS